MIWRKKYLRSYRRYPSYARRSLSIKRSYPMKYRTKTRSRTPIHRGGLRRPTGRTTKLFGIRTRRNTKPEQKNIVLSTPGFRIRNASWTVLWSTFGVDPNGIEFFPMPSQGTGVHDIIGRKFNSKFVDVKFNIRFNTLTTTNGWNSNEMPPSYFMYRIVVLRQRTRQSLVNSSDLPSSDYLTLNTSLDSKKWDIQYDRVHTLATGAKMQISNAATADPKYMLLDGPTIPSRPKRFRFKIPIKQTINMNYDETGYSFDRDVVVLCWLDRYNPATDNEGSDQIYPLLIDNRSHKWYFQE